MLWKSVPAKNLDCDRTGYPAIRDWREQNRVVQDIAAWIKRRFTLMVAVLVGLVLFAVALVAVAFIALARWCLNYLERRARDEGKLTVRWD